MTYRKICYQIYWKLQSIIVPNLEYSKAIYEIVLNENLANNPSMWLDLGCGHQLLPPWRYEQECKMVKSAKFIVGYDYDLDSLKKHKTFENRVRGDISHLPFADGSFAIVTANMVFEHLKDPNRQMMEIYRVLKPGGILIFHTPNSLSYGTILARLIPEKIKNKVVLLLQGREEEDVFPAYYRINSVKEIRRLSKLTGFEIDQIRLITSSAQLVMIPPLVIFELLIIKILMLERMKAFRTNIIARLRKPLVES
jgi:ubiquinone/menaquinone biosynthesis C-methylase UbiE